MTNQKTSSEIAYLALFKAIKDNRLPKGEFLSQRMLSQLAGTSIISTREALKRLEHEHLLEAIPKWGVRIPIQTRERIISLHGIREALEVMTAYLLARDMTDDMESLLYKKAEECDLIRLEPGRSIDDMALAHRDFHLYMADLTGNSQLTEELRRIGLHSLLFQKVKSDGEEWERWHRSLAEAIISRDVCRAQDAMHKHIQHGMENDLEMFERGLLS